MKLLSQYNFSYIHIYCIEVCLIYYIFTKSHKCILEKNTFFSEMYKGNPDSLVFVWHMPLYFGEVKTKLILNSLHDDDNAVK